MACLLSSINAFAYDFEVDGFYYDVVSLSDLTCKVTSGDNKYAGDIVIPNKVNYSNKTLTVVEIGEYAFSQCEEMTGITIPNTIISIGNDAFNRCSKLKHVKIEDGETRLKLGENKYYYKGLFLFSPLTSVYLGRNLLYKYSPFEEKEGIKDLTIGNSVTEIGSSEFFGCSGLTNVTIPNSVTEIGSSAFYGCSGLTNVTIPNSVTYIGEFAFSDCSGLTNVTIPNSVTEIGKCVFSGCSGLTNVTIPNSVTYIGESAFSGCSGLTSVTIPNSVTNIGYGAFRGCSGLTNVIIGNSVTEIGRWAFDDCSLTELYLCGTTPPETYNDNFTNNQYMTINVYVPQEALEAYQNAAPWKNFWNLQGFDPTGIKGIEIDGKDANGRWYDLRGNRLDAPKSGINIINGRKVMVK